MESNKKKNRAKKSATALPGTELLGPRCSLVCVGSELLRGKVNTHASTLARRLASIGLSLSDEQTVPDDQTVMVRAIRQALSVSTVVFVTGGLGPTFDDVSREAVALATGRKLSSSAELLAELKRKFKAARITSMPPANARQAQVIDGARVIANDFGTAPGQWLEWKTPSTFSRQVVVLLPGPPSELIPMVDRFVLPTLRKTFPPKPIAEAHLHFIGAPESQVDQVVRPIIERATSAHGAAIQFTILAHLGLVDFDIFVTAEKREQAEMIVKHIAAAVQSQLSAHLYGVNDDYPLEKVIGQKLRQSRATLAVAESCTGGLLAGRLTAVAGSSDYFLGGVVSYDDKIKEMALGVSSDVLSNQGAVSKEVAILMAEGVRERMGSSWGLSITGIAGPGGGTKAKPVGLVHMALAGPQRTDHFEFNFRGNRDAVRERAVLAALDLLRRFC